MGEVGISKQFINEWMQLETFTIFENTDFYKSQSS